VNSEVVRLDPGVTPTFVRLDPGTDVMILKIFSPKKIAKKMAFLIITLVFEKNAIFSPKIGKNRRKL
jgi:hypothetical protein